MPLPSDSSCHEVPVRTDPQSVASSPSDALNRSTGLYSPPGSESGETLIEVLLALIILALASVALLTAFGTDISASAEHRSLANFDTALASSIATTTTLIQEQYADVFAACPNPSGSLAAYPTETAMTSALNIAGYTASIEASGNLSPVEFANGNSYTDVCSASNVGEPQLIPSSSPIPRRAIRKVTPSS